eukprot:TRINITY_DN614_c0_g3_i1.p1 TRINITY_DN614_c0_g3~~TRINITY_DN614_c0_g3_i1.p1  ORF type:complete len:324 (-),score=78.91 TRINITY_DN614_c0_g3_i1:62-1033(-)
MWIKAAFLFSLLGLVYWFVSSRKKYSFEGKHVIITGGSTGIGKAVAMQLVHERIASITIMARTLEKLKEASIELRSHSLPSQDIDFVSVDVTDKAAIRKAVEQTVKRVGRVDCLIACAGLSTPGYFLEQDEKVFEQTMQLDYFGTLYAAKAVAPFLVKQNGGLLAFVGSTLSLVSIVGYSTYSPAKYAVRALAETLRSELKPYNIGVSMIYPPDTQTPGFDQENLTKPPECKEISSGYLLAKPEDLAPQIVEGLKAGNFHIGMDFGAKMSAALNPGLTPRTYPLLEALFSPIVALIGWVVMWQNDNVVMKHHKVRQAHKNKKE